MITLLWIWFSLYFSFNSSKSKLPLFWLLHLNYKVSMIHCMDPSNEICSIKLNWFINLKNSKVPLPCLNRSSFNKSNKIHRMASLSGKSIVKFKSFSSKYSRISLSALKIPLYYWHTCIDDSPALPQYGLQHVLIIIKSLNDQLETQLDYFNFLAILL